VEPTSINHMPSKSSFVRLVLVYVWLVEADQSRSKSCSGRHGRRGVSWWLANSYGVRWLDGTRALLQFTRWQHVPLTNPLRLRLSVNTLTSALLACWRVRNTRIDLLCTWHCHYNTDLYVHSWTSTGGKRAKADVAMENRAKGLKSPDVQFRLA